MEKLKFDKEKINNIILITKAKANDIWIKIYRYPYAQKIKKLQAQIKIPTTIKNIDVLKKIAPKLHWIGSSWKMLSVIVPLFIFFYYTLGSMITENIDVRSEYTAEYVSVPVFSTADTMSYLLKREVDEKMWTPNLPIIFPAYVLDNMPNFQIGVVEAVKNIAFVMRKFNNTEKQQQDINEAYDLLKYSPYVWLMSKQDNFKLSPSSNSQYRKAAKQLRQYGKDGVFMATADELRFILRRAAKNLRKLTLKSEEHIQEHSSDFIDTKADDLFYHNMGYSYALWQISKNLGVDFKNILTDNDVYEDWTYFVTSLKKAAQINPLIVRNGKLTSLFSANHLMVQNYYLMRAAAIAEKINNELLQVEDVTEN
ncbi:MAG: DUF2333 family protein [Alphaproteobacteria bacterium]|nr:DUF2333 family protein [Alphaproteobacteria bacterium]